MIREHTNGTVMSPRPHGRGQIRDVELDWTGPPGGMGSLACTRIQVGCWDPQKYGIQCHGMFKCMVLFSTLW